MANMLQADGVGTVLIPVATANGDFLVHASHLYITNPSTFEVYMGRQSGSTQFVTIHSGPKMGTRVGGSTFTQVNVTAGATIDFKLQRVGSTVTMYIDDVVVGTITTTSQFIIDRLFSYNSGAANFTGKCRGTLRFEGFDTSENPGVPLTREYDFNGTGTTLVDTVSGQDATLTGFTTGGFVVDPNPIGGTESSLVITSPTATNNAKQRNPANNTASFTFAGTITNPAANTIVQYSNDGATWNTLDASPDTTWTGNVTVTGRQIIQVRLLVDGVVGASDSIVCVAGAGVLIWGQSNASGRQNSGQVTSIDVGATVPLNCRNNATFTDLGDPTSYGTRTEGSIWPLVVSQLANANPDVCYVVMNVAEGNTGIDMWQKGGTAYSGGTLYSRIVEAATKFGGFEHCFSIIGERDASNAMSAADVETKYGQMTNNLFADYGIAHRIIYFPSLIYGTDGDTFRTGLDNLIVNNANAIFGGDLQVIDITDGDSLHLTTNAHAAAAAQIVYDALNSSVLTFTVSGIPDGEHQAVIQSVTDYSSILFTGLLTFSGESASKPLPVPAGTIVTGYMDGDGTDSTGALVRGVTV